MAQRSRYRNSSIVSHDAEHPSRPDIVINSSPYGNLNPVYESKTGSEGRVIDQPVIKQIASGEDNDIRVSNDHS